MKAGNTFTIFLLDNAYVLFYITPGLFFTRLLQIDGVVPQRHGSFELHDMKEDQEKEEKAVTVQEAEITRENGIDDTDFPSKKDER